MDGGEGDDLMIGDGMAAIALGTSQIKKEIFAIDGLGDEGLGGGLDYEFLGKFDFSTILIGGDDWMEGGYGDDVMIGDGIITKTLGGLGDQWFAGMMGGDPLSLMSDGDMWANAGWGCTPQVPYFFIDTLILGGDDTMFGGYGNDEMFGDGLLPLGGNAIAIGGDDKMFGGYGDDWMYGEGGSDLVVGDGIYFGKNTYDSYIQGGDDGIFGAHGGDRLGPQPD